MGCSGTKTINQISDEEDYYQKIEKIGEGAFGEVYLVISEKTNLKYIAKIINIKNPSDEKNMEKAHSEVQALIKCNHPNIISLKEAFKQRRGKDEVTLNIITEYCDEGDLQMKIKEQKKKQKHFEESQLIYWLMQICLGLKYIHENNIIHRDIKPSNIFLTRSGYVKLGDFGLSTFFDNAEIKEDLKNNKKNSNKLETDNDSTKDKCNKNGKLKRMESLKGTPSFLAPEVLVFHEYTQKVDIWALGVTFYYLMNFICPYVGNNLFDLCAKIALDCRQSICRQTENIYSPEFVSLVERMLSRRSQDRPSAESILNSNLIQKYMSPFLEKNNFDSETVSKFIEEYEEKHKKKNEEGQKVKEKTISEKNLLSDDIIEVILSKDIQELNDDKKKEIEKYEMIKIMFYINNDYVKNTKN